MSKSLNEVERNYDLHDREMLAIMRALDEWHHYPMGAIHSFEYGEIIEISNVSALLASSTVNKLDGSSSSPNMISN